MKPEHFLVTLIAIAAFTGCHPTSTVEAPKNDSSRLTDNNAYLLKLSTSDRVQFGRVPFAQQTEPQKVFSAVWALESQVNNGGFSQYFASSDYATANFAPQALRAIGAQGCANIVRRALRVVSDSPLPDSQSACAELVKALSGNGHARLEALDSEFMAYPDKLTDLLYAYVAARPKTFGPVPQ